MKKFTFIGAGSLVNFVKGNGLKTYVEFDGFRFAMLAFPMEDDE